MTDYRNPTSVYLSDQGKRTHLLDSLVCTYECIADICGVLLSLEDETISESERQKLTVDAGTNAMNVLADMKMVAPMLLDIYRDKTVDGSPLVNE